MNEQEARSLGRRTKLIARRDYITHDAQWWAGELSRKLGIVDADGMIDFAHPNARAFCAGFGGRP